MPCSLRFFIPRSAAALIVLTTSLACSQLRATIVTAPPIVVNALKHTFTPASNIPPRPAISRDSISIGDGNYTGGGAFSISSIANGDMANVRVEAPAGMKFVIHDANATLSLNFLWQAGGDAISLFGGTVVFENLTGSSPPTTSSLLGIGNGGNVIVAQMQFQPAGLIEFTAINMTIPVQSSPSSGPRNFGSVSSSSSVAFSASVTGGTDHTVMSLQATAVPEVSSWLMLGLVAAVAGAMSWRRRQ